MNKTPARILVIDDDQDVLQTARVVLRQKFSHVVIENNPQQLLYLLRNQAFDLVLLDMNFQVGATSGKEGLSWLRQIKELHPHQHVIMMTAYGDIKLAVEAMKWGASDFVVKPWENEKLVATVSAICDLSRSKNELSQLKNKQATLNRIMGNSHEIVGKSPEMRSVYATIEKVAQTEADILILGENGTGKELVAQAIHQRSLRNSEPFVKVDLGAVPDTLFESELFGHVKGAFTDAREERTGRLEAASGGTLFLDEIGNLTRTQQAKLLTVLQNREVMKLGSNTPVPIDVRLVSATNLPYNQLMEPQHFREDLLYRINTVQLPIPALRDRVGDIPLLAENFLRFYSQKYRKTDLQFDEDVMPRLERYRWPGNVRELQHEIERVVIMTDSPTIRSENFLIAENTAVEGSLKLEQVEKKTILDAIKQNGGNISKAAKALGLGRTTMYRKIRKYNLSEQDQR